MALRIEDYAILSDCETAALVGRDGSVDWLCLPRFDSPACFAALLGTEEHGRWLLAPPSEAVRKVQRRYRDDTLILETTFETNEGVATLIDFMPVRTHYPDLVRIVRGDKGTVPFRMQFVLRFDYGSIVPWVRRTEYGLRAIAGPDALQLRTDVELHGENLTTVAEFTVSAGQRVPFVATWHPSNEEGPTDENSIDPFQVLRGTERWWKEWAGRCTYDGKWRNAVIRSVITLKALSYQPTGGMIAAATTSLPEHLGGIRNWDYRYCWLRDATFTLYALMNCGYYDEAREWGQWLLRAAAGKPEDVQIMYGIAGERRLTEWEIPWLPGYENSKPVRIGNAAAEQFQLDVYGEVLDAIYQCRRHQVKPDSSEWWLESAMTRFVEKVWQKPDRSMWEMRTEPRQFTASKVLAWVALDRAVKNVEEFGLEGPVDQWRKVRQQIHDEVCEKGYSAKKGAFVQSYGSEEMDASLLLLPQVGFLPPSDPRIIGTVDAVARELTRDGLVRRYRTERQSGGSHTPEGVFLACSFWLADDLALLGRWKEAEELFERLLSLCNDVGLLAEEYEVHSGRQLGNFPQAFSHIGIINTACNLARQGPAQQRGKQEAAAR